MKKTIITLLVAAFTSSALAQISTQVIATGADAEKIYNSLSVSEHRINPSDEQSTLVKVVNFSSGGRIIQKGEKGMICDKYVSDKTIADMGTNYLCHTVDLTAK